MKRRMKTPVCGNGIVEIDEDCDCGMNKSCIAVEACCNPHTCRFYPGAECLSGSCCSGCKLLPSGYLCRSTQNTCDLPEFCDGQSAQCPDDDRLMDGTACPISSGTCFQGDCIDAQQQCVDLWGPGAKIAHDACYNNFNPTGSMTGHCGYDSRLHKYIPCFEKDVKCGLLHCQDGLPYPRIASTNFMIFHVNSPEGSFECKSISSPMNSILVNDGTMCGDNRFCQNNTCSEQSIKSNCHPQKRCSSNGVCTSLGFCSCYPNWTGKDCSTFDYEYSENQIFNQTLTLGTDSISPSAFAGISVIAFFLLILCMIISCLFRSQSRRQRTRQRSKSHELTKIPKDSSHQTQVTVNPQDVATDRTGILTSIESNLISTPMSLHRTPLMMSNRSITSACTGLSYLGGDTPRSVRYQMNRKTSNNGMFSDSETPRTRARRPIRYPISPYHHSNNTPRHQQSYATLTLKRPEGTVRYEASKKVYEDVDKLSGNENLRDFIQVLDSLAQEKFGGTHLENNSTMASSPTETNESITLDSGYQSTKQLMNNDEYAVIIKNKTVDKKYAERRRSYSSFDKQIEENSF